MQSFLNGGGGRGAGRERHPFKAGSRGLEQFDQIRGRNFIGRSVILFQDEHGRTAVSRKVDEVPAFTFSQNSSQSFAGDAVLEHANVDGKAAFLRKSIEKARELVAFPAQV